MTFIWRRGRSASINYPRNDSCHPKLCRSSCTLVTSTPTQKFGKFLAGVRSGTPIRLLFQAWSKSVKDKCPKGRVVLMMEKNKIRFGGVWQHPWGRFPHFFVRVRTTVPHLYSRFHLTPFRFEGVITEKPFHDPHSNFNISSSSP